MSWAEWDQLDEASRQALQAASPSGLRRQNQRDVLAEDVAAYTPGHDRYQRLLATCKSAGGVLVGLWDDEGEGADPGGKVLIIHPSDVAMLILGPPRSGKSSALLASMAMSAPGPTVCVSTKGDLYDVTAAARSQLGPLSWFSPVGDPAPSGAQAVGWSPITKAATWSAATRVARGLVEGERRTKLSNGADEHFQDLAARWLALSLFAAYLADEPIEAVSGWCSDPRAGPQAVGCVIAAFRALHEKESGHGQDGLLVGHVGHWDEGQVRRALQAFARTLIEATEARETDQSDQTDGEIEQLAVEAAVRAAGAASIEVTESGRQWVESLRDEVNSAERVWRLVRSLDSKERSSIFSTTFRALRAYQQAGGRHATRLPRFDADAFVRSGLDGTGKMPTLYVTASDLEQAETAAVICGLIQELQLAAHALARETHYRRDRPFLHLLLDECANIAPLPFLPELASQAGGIGIFLACAFQDLSQARRRWGEEAQGFLSLFQAKVLLRGISDRDTLADLSALAGDTVVTTRTLTDTPTEVGLVGLGNLQRRPDRWGRTIDRRSISDAEQFRPRLPVDQLHDIAAGRAWYYLGPDRVPIDLAFVNGWFTPAGVVESSGARHQPFWPAVLEAQRS